MTDPVPAEDSLPDLGGTIATLMPELKKCQNEGKLLIIVVCLVCLAVGVLIIQSDVEKQFLFLPVFAAGLTIAGVTGWVRTSQERLLMPHLARSMDLAYDKAATGFVQDLPQRLLPQRLIKAEDMLTGQIGGRAVRFAEVKVETGGKNSQVLFQGIVIRVPNATALPAFFLARRDQTVRAWHQINPRLSVEGLEPVIDTRDLPADLGIWRSGDAPAPTAMIEAAIDPLLRLPATLGEGWEVYTITSNREVTHVALQRQGNLFSIGGMMADEQTIVDGVKAAFGDMTIPYAIVSAVLAAEAAVSGKDQAHS